MVSFVSVRQTALTLVAAIVIAAPHPLLAQSQDVLTEHRVADIRSVGQIVASPDGGQVAYTVTVPRRPFVDPDGPAWSETLACVDAPCTGTGRWSSRQGCHLAGGSPAVPVAHIRHVAIPHPGPGNCPGYAWRKRPGCLVFLATVGAIWGPSEWRSPKVIE